MSKRRLVFEEGALEDFKWWVTNDRRIALKILELIEHSVKEPFSGPGKPEALKHDLKGYWSRRINDEHRLVYQVKQDELIVIACRYHYK